MGTKINKEISSRLNKKIRLKITGGCVMIVELCSKTLFILRIYICGTYIEKKRNIILFQHPSSFHYFFISKNYQVTWPWVGIFHRNYLGNIYIIWYSLLWLSGFAFCEKKKCFHCCSPIQRVRDLSKIAKAYIKEFIWW